jgi:hypothetical protein
VVVAGTSALLIAHLIRNAGTASVLTRRHPTRPGNCSCVHQPVEKMSAVN